MICYKLKLSADSISCFLQNCFYITIKFVSAKNFDNLDKEVLEGDAEDNESRVVYQFGNLHRCFEAISEN